MITIILTGSLMVRTAPCKQVKHQSGHVFTPKLLWDTHNYNIHYSSKIAAPTAMKFKHNVDRYLSILLVLFVKI